MPQTSDDSVNPFSKATDRELVDTYTYYTWWWSDLVYDALTEDYFTSLYTHLESEIVKRGLSVN